MKDPFKIQEQGYRYLYGWVPHRWRRHNFERAVGRMLRTGEIEKVVVGGQPIIRLSSSGDQKWVRDFSLMALSQKPWDGRWRILSFDIPEKLKGRRETLREKIERLGMGQLQESLYITPHDFGGDLQEFVEGHGLSDYVVVFEARHTFGEDAKSLAWRVWQLEKLEEDYNFLTDLMEKKLSRQDKFNLQVKFEEILLTDPLLPRELLPPNWIGFKVRKLILGNI